CRETLIDSWRKSLLEAVQGRHYVRFLKARDAERGAAVEAPDDFAQHAAFYSYHPERRRATVLEPATAGGERGGAERADRPRLGGGGGPRPVWLRRLPPPPLTLEKLGWVVVRVLVPGLQPLHGSHRLPFLGGEMWRPRGLREWGEMPPHPFP